MFDWGDLPVFLTLVRAGSLTGAARRLGMDQSTVGRRLAALEQATGTRLFERTTTGYSLTAAGEAVLGYVEAIESQTIAVERTLTGLDSRPAGHVRLATSDSLAAWFVVRHLPALRAAHPEIIVDLLTGNRSVDLARREADISLRLSRPTQPNMIARRLGIAAWAPYGALDYLAARGRPRLKTHFAGHDIIGFDQELAGTVGSRWLAEHASAGRTVLRTNSMICQGPRSWRGLA